MYKGTHYLTDLVWLDFTMTVLKAVRDHSWFQLTEAKNLRALYWVEKGLRFHFVTLHCLLSWKPPCSCQTMRAEVRQNLLVIDLQHHSDSIFSLTHFLPQRGNTKISSSCIISILYCIITAFYCCYTISSNFSDLEFRWCEKNIFQYL